ncbi:TonB-dependent receptor [Parahaliea sp. F7430]|uniref:TonB-dependent receptor n=1 Tax=Sediminihaliea albiluteola TaxID=2758564 RepID=A0A7W2TV14_9GAMM|nr:TonB-dependent receptor [Sediminihaliea albiluteola]MBA6412482.1 TonB-dependent receptor [Sediminihaliea albiluteola]
MLVARFAKNAIVASLVLGYCAVALPVLAQEIDELVVYATSQYSENRRSTAAAANISELSTALVSLQATSPDNKNTGIYLRGLGTTAFNDGMSSSVKLLQDGIYLGRQGMFPTRLYDIEKVSVERGPVIDNPGPTGSAGSIHVQSRPPSWAADYQLKGSAGSTGLRDYELRASGPLVGQVLAGRLSAYHFRRDGNIYNETQQRELNFEHHQAVRGQLLWLPSQTLSSRIIAEQSKLADDCCAYLARHYSDGTLARAAALGYELLPTKAAERRVASDRKNRRNIRQRALSIDLDWLPNDKLNLSSMSGWREWRYDSDLDLDGIALPITESGGSFMSHRQLSQELRLQVAPSANMELEFAALYLQQQHRREGQLVYGSSAASWYLAQRDAAAIILEGARVRTPMQQKAETASLLAKLLWLDDSGWSATAAMRYSWDKRRARGQREISGLQELPSDANFATVAALLRNLALGQNAQDQASNHSEHLDLSLKFDYPLSEGLIATFSLASVYKPAGVNGELVSADIAKVFDSESGTAVSAALLWQSVESDSQLQLRLYQQQVSDYQALSYNPESSPLNPQMNNIINVERVRSRGVELEAQFALHSQLRFSYGSAYNDARYQRFPNAPCAPSTGAIYCDYSNLQMVNAPRWTAFAALQHDYALQSGVKLYSAINYQWRSAYMGHTARGEGSEIGSRGLLTLHVGWRQQNWDLRLWADNALDKDYVSAIYALTGSGDYGAILGQPRALGLTLKLGF